MSGFSPSVSGGSSGSSFFQQINQFRQNNPGQRLTINDLANQRLNQSDNSTQSSDGTSEETASETTATNNGPRGRTVETGRAQDIRTDNESFIALGSGENRRFSRSASLELDAQGNVRDGITGQRLQEVTENAEGGTVTEGFQISTEERSVDAQATTEADIGGNLSRLTDVGESVEFTGEVTNSAGNAESVSFQATRTGENQFQLTAEDPDSGENALNATVSFNEEGQVESTSVQANSSGNEGLTLSTDTGEDVNVSADNLDLSGLSLKFGDNTAGLTRENGTSGGQLESLSVTDNGQLQGSYSDGQTQTLGEVATATFDQSSALTELNDGTFAANDRSGTADFSSEAQFSTGELETQNSQNTSNMVDELLGDASTAGRSRGELLGAALDISI